MARKQQVVQADAKAKPAKTKPAKIETVKKTAIVKKDGKKNAKKVEQAVVKTKEGKKDKKNKKTTSEDEKPAKAVVLPSVADDPVLANLSANSRKLEKAEESKEKVAKKKAVAAKSEVKVKKSKKAAAITESSTEAKTPNKKTKKQEQSAADPPAEPEALEAAPEPTEAEASPVAVARVKVKRKGFVQTTPSVDESEEKTYLSISDPAEDNKQLNVPSYSYKKNRGIVYISHVPHGFYEKQMREFFSQFGTVTNLRLGRSKKTGGSKGYAFVEFKYKEVAKIVAETMNNYLMFERLLKVQLLEDTRNSKAIFANKINEKRPPKLIARQKARQFLNSDKDEKMDSTRKARSLKRADYLKKSLAKAGIDYSVTIG